MRYSDATFIFRHTSQERSNGVRYFENCHELYVQHSIDLFIVLSKPSKQREDGISLSVLSMTF